MLEGASEAALGRALRIADPRAEREAWRRFRPLVYRIALYAVGSRHTADAIATRVLAAFLERAARRSARQSPTTLVLWLSVRAIRRQLRWAWLWGRREPGPRSALPTLAEAAGDSRRGRSRFARPSASRGVRNPSEGSGTDRTVQAAISRFLGIVAELPPATRTAFVLRHLEGRELDEVAAALRKGPHATGRLLRRSWQSLASRVERDPVLADLLPALALRPADGDAPAS